MRECRYLKMCHTPYVVDFDVCYPCIGDGADTCASYEPMVDRDALLDLATDMETWAEMQRCAGSIDDPAANRIGHFAERIRGACGEVAG